MAVSTGMNLLSIILIGALLIAVCAVVWYLLTRRRQGSGVCCGSCAGCTARCDRRKENQKES